tara:strand:- start:14553 stop:15626 length:1074 start_codon:yes stop_codon:yes gene_type:complete
MNDDIVIIACGSVDAVTENVQPKLTENNQWVFCLPGSFSDLVKKLISDVPAELTIHVNKVILSSSVQDSGAKNQTFIEEKILNKRRVKPSMALDALGVSSTSLFLNAFDNAEDIFGIDAACATGLKSIEMAIPMVESGDVVLVATVEKPTAPYFLYYFHSLNALANGGEQYKGPFDSSRNGLAMADGGGYVMLCKRSVARNKQLPVIATIKSVGSRAVTSLVAPSDIGKLTDFIKGVIKASDLHVEDFSHWDAHATATPAGDIAEYDIFKQLMPQDTLLSSAKGHVGHSMAACGLVELSHSIKNLAKGIVKSNGSLYNTMVSDHRIVTADTLTTKRSFIKTSFGFGGRNSAIVLTVE